MISLHTHTNYSLLEGTIRIEDLVTFAKRAGSPYAAITDTNAMYGWIRFIRACNEQNIKPLLGAHIDDPADAKLNAVLIAKNDRGYGQLCRIITSRKLNDKFNLARLFDEPLDDIFVIISSLELLHEMKDEARRRSNVFVGLSVTAKTKSHSRELFEYAKQNHLNITAVHPSYFTHPGDHLLCKVVHAIRLGSTLANITDDEFPEAEYHLKTPDEFAKTWRGLPEAIWNADKIAQSCNVDPHVGEYKFPSFPLPPGESSFSFLWKLAFEGLSRRYQPITDQAIKRLQYELEVIDELGYSDYFLIVWDIIKEAKQRGMLHIGRGSAANSLVSYCLGFTEIDPILHNLYFERFLNRGRTSPPDVDLDFSWKERDSIIKYIFEKYGYDKVAMISTTVTFRARSAFREVAKVFGISESEISKFSKFIPWTSAHNLPGIAEKFPETKSLQFQEEPWKTIVNIAAQLAEYPRHLSIHPSGIIITRSRITDYVALEYAKNKGLGLIITQPDMYSTEDLGLIKIDMLSQRSLGVLKLAMNEINRHFVPDEPKPPGAVIFKMGG